MNQDTQPVIDPAQQPPQPQPAPLNNVPQSSPDTLEQPKKKKSLFLPIFLMAWPAIGIIAAIALYAVVNLIFASTAPAAGQDAALFDEPSPVKTILNILLFIVGLGSVLLGPISFIVGIVLLVLRLKK